jgi:hypothetical protein
MVVDVRGGVLQHRCGRGKRDLAPIWVMEKLEGHSPERGKTTAALSKIRREGEASGSGKQVRRMPGQWGSVCGAQAWTGDTNGARGRRIRPAGGGEPFLKGAGGGRNRRGVG